MTWFKQKDQDHLLWHIIQTAQSMQTSLLDYCMQSTFTQASKQCSHKESREWDGDQTYQTINPALQGIKFRIVLMHMNDF
jgi:hypothetical protein